MRDNTTAVRAPETHAEVRSAPVTTCQICGSPEIDSVLFVGYVSPVNTMPQIGVPPTEHPTYPLELLRCRRCTLVQIGFEVDPYIVFPSGYPYLSGSTRILRENFIDLAAECADFLRPPRAAFVVDIGSNDGTLLRPFRERGFRVLGIEPTQVAEVANAAGIPTEVAYFNRMVARSVQAAHGTADLITAANVFAHMRDTHGIVNGILDLLAPDGVFVSESHYLLGLVATLQYDTIYHEHLRYYSVRSIAHLLREHGLDVFHVRGIPTHGGSIRVYAARAGQRVVQQSVAEFLEREDAAGLTDGSALRTFRQRAIQSKLDLYALLQPLKAAGARIYGISAPSRASTLINFTGLNDGIIDCIMEVATSPKVGKYVPGTRIPVLDEAKLYVDQPEYALLFSWHIADELVVNLRRKGFRGKFIVPLPSPQILDV